jgi:RNA polymerase sigma factor (sigma-70 family)
MQPSDEQLALSAFEGDKEAFAKLYERHYQGIHDFIARMAQDPDVADDLGQSTFVKAWENLRMRQVTGNIKAWLYTIARNNTINELKRRKWVARPRRTKAEDESPFPYTVIDSSRLADPQGALEDNELVDLVWESATALNHKEYALLDMHLRRGLNAGELACALGVRRNNMNTMLYRLRRSIEESVVATLLARRGRRDCPELDALVADLPADGPTLAMRRAIVRHLDGCERCQESKKRYTSPVEIFSGLALLPVSAELQASNWQAIKAGIGSAGAGASPLVRVASRPLRWWGRATTPLKAAAVATVAAIVGVPVAVTLALALGSGASSPSEPVTTHGQATGVLAVEAEPMPASGVKLVGVRVRSPASALAGEVFEVFASADLLYGGPTEVVLADTTFAFAAPPDCSVSPGAPVTWGDTSLPRSVDVSIARGWEVSCVTAGVHDFVVDVTVAIDPSEPVTDPDPIDNSNSGMSATEILQGT